MARRLPVIQNDESEDAAAAARPRLQWIVIGAGLTVTIWAPLALVAMPLGVRLATRAFGATGATTGGVPPSPGAAALAAAPVVLSFLFGALASGALVGRFGGKAGPREAALGGVLGAAGASLLGLRPGLGLSIAGIFAIFSLLSLFGAAGGALGGHWGRRSRHEAVLDSKSR
jgi:tRNA-(ms[2]io[6]A)-hydroxylase